MDNQIGLVISLLFLSVFIMFSYEVISYQKSIAKALIETNDIAIQIQKSGYNDGMFVSHNTFKKVEVEKQEFDTHMQYKITTIMPYRCEINFFDFSNEDITTNIYVCSNF